MRPVAFRRSELPSPRVGQRPQAPPKGVFVCDGFHTPASIWYRRSAGNSGTVNAATRRSGVEFLTGFGEEAAGAGPGAAYRARIAAARGASSSVHISKQNHAPLALRSYLFREGASRHVRVVISAHVPAGDDIQLSMLENGLDFISRSSAHGRNCTSNRGRRVQQQMQDTDYKRLGSANGNRTRRLAVQASPDRSKWLCFQCGWYSGMLRNTATNRRRHSAVTARSWCGPVYRASSEGK